jgi:hypothetical protein
VDWLCSCPFSHQRIQLSLEGRLVLGRLIDRMAGADYIADSAHLLHLQTETQRPSYKHSREDSKFPAATEVNVPATTTNTPSYNVLIAHLFLRRSIQQIEERVESLRRSSAELLHKAKVMKVMAVTDWYTCSCTDGAAFLLCLQTAMVKQTNIHYVQCLLAVALLEIYSLQVVISASGAALTLFVTCRAREMTSKRWSTWA